MVSLQRFAGRFVPVVAWLWCVGAIYAQPVRAESAYDARQRKLAEGVLAQGKTPEAQLDLLRMVRASEEADPELTLAAFRKLSEARGLDPQHRVFAARRVAWDLRRTGKVA